MPGVGAFEGVVGFGGDGEQLAFLGLGEADEKERAFDVSDAADFADVVGEPVVVGDGELGAPGEFEIGGDEKAGGVGVGVDGGRDGFEAFERSGAGDVSFGDGVAMTVEEPDG